MLAQKNTLVQVVLGAAQCFTCLHSNVENGYFRVSPSANLEVCLSTVWKNSRLDQTVVKELGKKKKSVADDQKEARE